MSSLADLPELVGFFSYSRKDDDDTQGALTQLRLRIQRELRLQLGRSYRLWQDTAAIPDGALWEDEIERAIAESVFFIPIVTPSSVGSPHCKFEFESFLGREAVLGRDNLIFPIVYIRVPALENEAGWRQDDVLKIIGTRQYTDWQKFRHRDLSSPEVAERIEHFCRNIFDALRRPWVSPEEQRIRQAAEARERAEAEERARIAAEAARQKLEREAAAKREAEERAREAASAEAQRQSLERETAAQRAAEEKALAEERRKKEEDERRARKLQPSLLPRRALVAACVLGVALIGFVGILIANLLRTPVQPQATRVEGVPAPVPSKTAPVPPAPPPVQPSPAPAPATPVQAASSSVGPLSTERERALQPKDSFTECSNCPEMVVVPAGSFTMGSPASEPGRYDDESPQHRVTIAKPFSVAKFDVTFDEWDACAADGGCNSYKPSDQGWGRGSRPVINVSWDDAQQYVAWLSRKTGKPYRLLSEAEWEYAARAGTTTAYYWGAAIGKNNADCVGCGSQWDNKETAPVGSFAANAFGLYDMAGNVWQWTQDCYHDSYKGAPGDGSAWTSGNCSSRVVRGGSWGGSPLILRSANRTGSATDVRSNFLGFRVGRTLTP